MWKCLCVDVSVPQACVPCVCFTDVCILSVGWCASRCGFNSQGMVAVQRNLRDFENRRCDYSPGLLGVNVGE